MDYPFASRREDPGSNLRGFLCETGTLLLALSRYIGDPDMILTLAFDALQWVLH